MGLAISIIVGCVVLPACFCGAVACNSGDVPFDAINNVPQLGRYEQVQEQRPNNATGRTETVNVMRPV